MKKGIVVILAVLLTIGTGFLIPVLTQNDKGNYIKEAAGSATPKVTKAVAVASSIATSAVIAENTETPMALVTPLATPDTEYKSDVELGTPEPEYRSDVNLGTPSPTVEPQETQVSVQEGNETSTPKPVVSSGKEDQPTPQKTDNSESVSWVDRKIKEHRDEIDDNDLADFRRIYSSLNIAYVQSIMNDGLDDEGMTKLKSYLRNTLGGDYERAKELFYEYSYLLSEV